jgi:macrolide transport system ATP-binding/permease protein
MTDWRAYVRAHLPPLACDAQVESAIVEELVTQLQDIHDAAIRAGVPPDEAERVTRGEVTDWAALGRDLVRARTPVAARTQPLTRAGARAVRILPMGPAAATFLRDVVHAARALRSEPLFAATTILTFALGIGATTVAYSLVHAVIVAPLAYPEPDRLALIRQVVPEIAQQYPIVGVNPRSFLRWQASCQSTCDGIAAFTADSATLTADGQAEGVAGLRATPELFGLLGAAPLHGRLFTADETTPGRDTSVVLSHGLWQRRFGGNPAIVGRTIRLSDVPVVVAGVLSPTFRFPQLGHRDPTKLVVNAPDYVRPLAWPEHRRTSFGEYDNLVIVRLTRGQSLEAARAELASLTTTDFAQAPIHPYPVLEPLSVAIISDARRPLSLLLGAVATTLLIACVNVANLLGVRCMGRRRELAIRTAIGAGRARLMSLVAAESVLLAGVGGLLGATGAWLALDAIVARVPVDIPRLEDIHLDFASLACAVLVTAGCALCCAVLPAWQAAVSDPGDALKDSARTTTDSGRFAALRTWLVSGEITLTSMLLVVGGLLLTSFMNLLRVDPGFSTASVVTADLSLPGTRYPDEGTRARFFDQLLTALDDMPGIASASTARRVPLEGDGSVDAIIRAGDSRPLGEQPIGSHIQVSPSYFRTVGMALLHGRLPLPSDRARRVAVISERTARIVWGTPAQAIGRTYSRSRRDVEYEVIGVVADTRQWGLDRSPGLVTYVPYLPEDAENQVSLVVRTRPHLPTAAALARIRAAVHDLDPQLALQRTQTLDQVVDRSLALRRFQLKLVAGFAGVGLLLAGLGIYGVSAQAVERRRNELAIRLALGATPSHVRRMVVRQGLTPVAVGIVIGLGLGLIVARALAAMLFEVSPSEPLVIAATLLIVLAAAVAACLGPAARAAGTRLATALRGS